MSHHRLVRMGEEESLRLWKDCLRRFIRDHLIEFPAFREEARIAGIAGIAGIDGITMKSVYTGEIRNPATGEVVNAKQVTNGFEAGSAIAKSLPKSKSGHGYVLVDPASARGWCSASPTSRRCRAPKSNPTCTSSRTSWSARSSPTPQTGNAPASW
jgi:hypothetical protein